MDDDIQKYREALWSLRRMCDGGETEFINRVAKILGSVSPLLREVNGKLALLQRY